MRGSVIKLPPVRFLSKVLAPNDPVPRYFSLIDLGADTIKVAVVEVADGRVQVWGHSLATTGGRDVAGGRAEAAALAAIVNNALQEAEDASEAGAGHKIVPDHALFILPGRTLAGKQFAVKQRRPRPTQPITQQEVDALWERAIRLARQGLPTLPDVGADWLPQSVTLAGLWLDDHLVNDPVGLQGASLSLAVFGVICRPAIIRALEQLSKRLDLEIYRMVAASQAMTTIIPSREALVFDVGASGTDFYLIRHDALIEVGRSFMGGQFFTRALSRTFKSDIHTAETLKIAFSSAGVLSDKDRNLVQQGLQKPLERWAVMMAETVIGLAGREPLPGDVYFVGGSAMLPGLRKHLLSGFRQAGLSFERAPEFVSLGEKPLNGFAYAPTGFRGMLLALVLSLGKTI